MTRAAWYLRRAIPWVALLGCCAGAVVGAGAVHRWPSTAAALVPAILGCCAAACAFVFDERDAAVTAVTPLAAWRRAARLAVVLLPFGLWSGIVLSRPEAVPLDRPGWLLIGAALTLLTVGIAALAARREQAAPGSGLASVVAIAVFAPVVLGTLFDWGSVYPFGDFSTAATTFWLVVGGAGGLACLVALRTQPPGRTRPSS